MQKTLLNEKNFALLVDRAGGWDESAKVSKRSIAQLKRYAKGDDPPFSVVTSLCDAAGVGLEWLSSNSDKGSDRYGFNDQEQNKFAPAGQHLVFIPIMNVTASAGDGAVVVSEKESGTIGFSEVWLHQQGLNSADLFTMPSTGESMEPTIKAGEYLLCSKAEHHIKPGDGIFVIRLEGDILVKRLQRLPGNNLQVSSDNSEHYKPFNIDLNDGVDFKILGKVVVVHGARRV